MAALTPSAQKAAFHVRDRNGRDLCLKVISPGYDADRLHREIAALQAVQHENVAALVEYTFTSKPHAHRHFLVEEFIEGDDLALFIKPGEPWELSCASEFFAASLG